MGGKASKVFLSYARRDSDAVKKVGHQLQQAGFTIWDPDEEILPGADWTTELKTALDSAAALIVFISPEAMESRFVTYEIEYALGARHLRGRLIPVMVRPTKNAPWILNSLQSVRYESPGKTSRQIVDLLSQPQDDPEAKLSAI